MRWMVAGMAWMMAWHKEVINSVQCEELCGGHCMRTPFESLDIQTPSQSEASRLVPGRNSAEFALSHRNLNFV